MKRPIVVALVIGLVAGFLVLPADAKKNKKKKKTVKVEREAVGSYAAPAVWLVGDCSQTGAIGCVRFEVGAEELWVTGASITDQHGQPVQGTIYQDTDGDDFPDHIAGGFCGELQEPVRFRPNAAVDVWIGTPTLGPSCPGQGTSGTVNITFSNLP